MTASTQQMPGLVKTLPGYDDIRHITKHCQSQRTHDNTSLRFESARSMYMGELAW
jgi:hypothetical protein